jgi:integral membrane sensor domain MASE1
LKFLSATPRTLLVFLLPFLLWAMVRFGPGGTSLSLLATAMIAMWAASHGCGPFAGLPPAESVLTLQLSLVMSVQDTGPGLRDGAQELVFDAHEL